MVAIEHTGILDYELYTVYEQNIDKGNAIQCIPLTNPKFTVQRRYEVRRFVPTPPIYY